MAVLNKKLMVQRECFEKNGKTFYSYFIKGNVRGKDVTVRLVPSDVKNDFGGYELLDLVFGDANSAELMVVPFDMTDKGTGKVITVNRFVIQTQDEDGILYECSVKPSRPSDKSILNVLIQKAS